MSKGKAKTVTVPPHERSWPDGNVQNNPSDPSKGKKAPLTVPVKGYKRRPPKKD